jgi:hypothetical protein
MGESSRVEKQKTLEEYVGSLSLRRKDILKNIEKLYKEVVEGRIILEDPDPPKNYFRYITRPDYNLWLYTVSILTISTILVVALNNELLSPIRWFLGTLFVLFIPGYLTIEALYPEEESLKPLERVALSIGLSLAIVPLIGLILNYSPWGIRLEPIMISLSIYNIVLMIIASYRKYRLLRLVLEIKRK